MKQTKTPTKYFNTTGLCNPIDHYMVDPIRGLKDEIYDLIKKKQYFTIHAPRQTGKTTLLHALARQINKEAEYISVVFSVEQAGYESISEQDANWRIINSLYEECTKSLDKKYFPQNPQNYKDLNLKTYLTDWSRSQKKTNHTTHRRNRLSLR